MSSTTETPDLVDLPITAEEVRAALHELEPGMEQDLDAFKAFWGEDLRISRLTIGNVPIQDVIRRRRQALPL